MSLVVRSSRSSQHPHLVALLEHRSVHFEPRVCKSTDDGKTEMGRGVEEVVEEIADCRERRVGGWAVRSRVRGRGERDGPRGWYDFQTGRENEIFIQRTEV